MRNQTLNINDVYASRCPVVYTCHGLGSCIAVFVTDRQNGLSGGAHIPLPVSMYEGDFLDAVSMIDALMLAMEEVGSDLRTLCAKVTGGSQVFADSSRIGEQNSEVVLKQLTSRRIFIAAADVGGCGWRTARFNSVTRELQISSSGLTRYCI